MIKNYTTVVPEEKTVGEIMALLAAKGARSVQIGYDEQGRPQAITFIVFIESVPIPFQLPCNFDGVFKAMLRDYKDARAKYRFERDPKSRIQARKIAWRIIKDWVAAQMALIEAEQASLAQVFLPYVKRQNGLTLFDDFMLQVTSQHALPEGRMESQQ